MPNLGLHLEAGGLLTTSQMVCMSWGNDGEHHPYTTLRAHQKPPGALRASETRDNVLRLLTRARGRGDSGNSRRLGRRPS